MTSIVYNKDCMEDLPYLPDNSFDLAIVDIPYGISVSKMAFVREKKTTVKQKNGTRLSPHSNKKRPAIANLDHPEWDNETPTQEYFDQLKRVSRHQIIFGADYTNWEGLGPGKIIWDKCVPSGVSFKGTESAHCSFLNFEYTIQLLWSGMRQAASLKTPTVQQGNKRLNEKRIHPCHKPVLLYMLLLKMFADPTWRILDTHLGGGSSRIACDMFGIRSFTGYEINPHYLQLHEERWQQYTSQQRMQL